MRRTQLAFLRTSGLLLAPVLFSTACPGDDTSITTSADDSSSTSEGEDTTTSSPMTTTPDTTETMDPDSSSSAPTTDTETDPTTTTDPSTTEPEESSSTDPTEDTTSTGELCGNGSVDDGEECDGDDLADATCVTQEFDEGTLACNADCTFDTDACTLFTCGNNEVEGKEVCDGPDLGGADCVSEGFPLGGTLACGNNCGALNTDGCLVSVCGNNAIEDVEGCDGDDLGGATCESLGFAAGNLSCFDDCSDLDISDCTLCGNGIVDMGETCDGGALNGQDCFSQGYDGGNLGCTATCDGFDVNACLEEAVTQFCVQPALGIVDNATVTTQLVVAGLSGTVTDVNVSIEATHTWVSDLTMTTTHLDTGSPVTLFQQICGSTDNVNVVFDGDSVAQSCPLTGPTTMQAIGDLEGYAGLIGDGNGTYELAVNDAFSGDIGTVSEWCIDVTTLAPVGPAPELRPNLMQCGFSDRNVASFIPDGVDLTLVEGCIPDDLTQAIVINRNGMVDGPALQAYVAGGGIVLTEVFISDQVFNAIYNTAVAEGAFTGACQDIIPTVVQFSPGDEFWSDNPFQAIQFNESGCGTNIVDYPGIVPLSGWSANEVAVGYRDDGAGRVWLTEFDWQDNDAMVFDYTEDLMGYMILNNGDGGGGGAGQQDFAFTGGEQQFVVPPGVTSVHIAAFGAQGGDAQNNVAFCGASDVPGLGGHAEGDLSVTPGEVLSIYVGGAGGAGNAPGFNGGGGSCADATTCSSGGGASDVRQGGNTINDRVLVAGAGGGAEWSCAPNGGGGAGGGLDGGSGLNGDQPANDGLGGSQVAGGNGGPGAPGLGENGSLGQGGAAEADSIHGGGGGGGFYGGGGGGTDGHGGGGSSYLAEVDNGVTNSGVQAGNGSITITWN